MTPLCSLTKAVNPTPFGLALQPALRADVVCAGEGFAPGALTCTVFDPMVHPVIEVMKTHFGSALSGESSFAKSRQNSVSFSPRDKPHMAIAKMQHRGIRWLTLQIF